MDGWMDGWMLKGGAFVLNLSGHPRENRGSGAHEAHPTEPNRAAVHCAFCPIVSRLMVKYGARGVILPGLQ
jgi:hypothetical protein